MANRHHAVGAVAQEELEVAPLVEKRPVLTQSELVVLPQEAGPARGSETLELVLQLRALAQRVALERHRSGHVLAAHELAGHDELHDLGGAVADLQADDVAQTLLEG
jgi:hypothetical protein